MTRLLVILVPFMVLSNGLLHRGHHIGLIAAALLCVSAMIRSTLVRMFAWYVAAYFIAIQLLYVAGRLPAVRSATSIGMGTFILLGFCVYVAAARADDFKRFKIEDAICLSAIVQTLLTVCQVNGFDPFFSLLGMLSRTERALPADWVVGSLGNTNFLSAYLVLSAPFFWRPRWKWFLLPIGAILILAKTSTAIVALAVGSVVFFHAGGAVWRGIRVSYPIAIGWAVAAFGYIKIFDPSGTGGMVWRLDTGMSIINRILASPVATVFGFGPGASTGLRCPLHNDWLEMWFQFGAVGVVLGILYVLSAIRSSNRMLAAAVAIVAVNALGNYPFELAPSAFLIMAVLGTLERGTT